MNINGSIIDQQVSGLAGRLRLEIEQELETKLDNVKAHSVGFVVLCAKLMLDLTESEAIETLTEGGNDFGVEAIHVSAVNDGEFVVTLFQCKYTHENLEGIRGFPQNGVEKAVQAVRTLFDPGLDVSQLNQRLRTRIEEVRSFILDGQLPRIRFCLCNNGDHWKRPEAQAIIDREQFGDRATFGHVNHDSLVKI